MISGYRTGPTVWARYLSEGEKPCCHLWHGNSLRERGKRWRQEQLLSLMGARNLARAANEKWENRPMKKPGC